MTSISGVSFSEAWRGRVRIRIGNRVVGFLGKRQFVKNKTSAGRPKDLLDLALLAEAVTVPRGRHRTGGPSRRRGKT